MLFVGLVETVGAMTGVLTLGSGPHSPRNQVAPTCVTGVFLKGLTEFIYEGRDPLPLIHRDRSWPDHEEI